MPRLRERLRDPAAAVAHEVGADLSGFEKFILRGNVVDLAVGIVIGAAFGNVVQALVKDVLTPLIGAFGGTPDFAGWSVRALGARLLLGDLLNGLIAFLLIAAVVYFLVVLPVNRLMDRYRPQPQPAPTKDCPECLSTIPAAARRCPICTAQLASPSPEVAEAMRQVAAPSGAALAEAAARTLAARLQGGETAVTGAPTADTGG
jgi:large conductance mechanosensitive channel